MQVIGEESDVNSPDAGRFFGSFKLLDQRLLSREYQDRRDSYTARLRGLWVNRQLAEGDSGPDRVFELGDDCALGITVYKQELTLGSDENLKRAFKTVAESDVQAGSWHSLSLAGIDEQKLGEHSWRHAILQGKLANEIPSRREHWLLTVPGGGYEIVFLYPADLSEEHDTLLSVREFLASFHPANEEKR